MAWEVFEVSKYTTLTDYNAAATSINGVLIRVGYRGYGASGTITVDPKLQTHYEGFKDTRRKIGFYFFSTAISEDEAVEEANFVYNNIKNYRNDFPVYFQSDYSNATHDGRSDYLRKSERTIICKAFCERIKALGYRAGVLAKDSWYDIALDVLSLQAAEYSIIVSRYSDDPPMYVTNYDAWEYTDTGEVHRYDGAATLIRFYKDKANWSDEGGGGHEPTDINDCTIEIIPSNPEYNDGDPVEPRVVVYGLNIGSDFLVEYRNNIKAGLATAIITGIGDYTGTATKTFTIIPKDISTKSLEFRPTRYEYNGEYIIPNYYIYGLSVNVDYTMKFTNNKEVGIAEGTATGINNYTGTLSRNFNIVRGNINNVGQFTLDPETMEYTGEELKPRVISPKESVKEGVDYKVEYQDNIDIGTGKVLIVGINSYTDTQIVEFSITKKTINTRISLKPNKFTYNGEPCCPVVDVAGLEEGVDFSVTYEHNINAGTARAIITGEGNYTGQTIKKYKIIPRSISDMAMIPAQIEDQYFNGEFVQPDITISGLVKDYDYITRYKNNKKVGYANMVITGIGNYKDTVNVPFEIEECPISMTDVKYGRPSVYTTYRIDDGKVHVLFKDKELVEGRDYILKSKTIVRKPEYYVVTITIYGINGFVDVGTYSYRVIGLEPEAEEQADDGKFNFGDIELDDESAEGDWDFGDIDDEDPESHTPEDGDFDFDALCGMYTGDYDEITGLEVDEEGTPIDQNDDFRLWDDGVYNFGDIDLGDESAEGDYDFGDLDEGKDVDSVVRENGDYDFNRFPFPEGYDVGKEYILDNTPIYANYCSTTSDLSKSGSYLIYKPQIMDGKIRMTKLEDGLNKPARSTGWVKIEDLDRLGLPKLGDKVYVNGDLRRYLNSDTPTINIENKLMYVVSIADEHEYEYAYGVSDEPNTKQTGFANLDMLSKYNEYMDDDDTSFYPETNYKTTAELIAENDAMHAMHGE